jgi:hypothetical protein
LTTRNATWSQSLAGESKAYAAYWSELLQTAAGESQPVNDWEMQPAFPNIGEPAHARLQSMSVQSRAIFGPELYLGQDPIFPFRWTGIYWPETKGWKYANTAEGKATRWFVWPPSAWQSLHRRQRWNETRQFIASRQTLPNQHYEIPPLDARPTSENTPIPKAPFFAIFILCLGFLWAERKMEWMSGRIVR